MTAAAAYLDYNATAPLRPVAVEAVVRALATVGNPSSVHAFGRAARRLVEEARETVAETFGAAPAGVIFTSGGTEANALALGGFGRRRILVSAVEHPSVLKWGVGEPVPVNDQGIVDLDALERMLAADKAPAQVAVMLANNETGAIQPVAAVVGVAHRYGALVHCDAVQAAGKITVDVRSLGADSTAVSAHKLGGPQGVGALILADAEAEMAPLQRGGGQERRRRAGTENVPGVAGFAAALAACRDELDQTGRLAALRDRLEQETRRRAAGLVVFAEKADRLPNTSCLAVPGVSSQTAVMALDLAGVAVSAGSACSSGKVGPSHVLASMGAAEMSGSAIRVSLGWSSSERDVERFVDAFGSLVERTRTVRT